MEQLGPYQVVEEIGRGGMGVVYRGLDPVIGRPVAIKTIRLADVTEPSERQELEQRLFREAQSAGILSHPGIVTVYQVGQENDITYIAMEYIDGPTLSAALERGRPSLATAAGLLRQAAEALDYAHARGVVHRDIKPSNLMLTSDGRLKIADFGIAKIASSAMTRTGQTVGSPHYMSPEQVQSMPVDGRSDQYSLAIVAYQMLTGARPYEAETLSALVFKIVFEGPDLAALTRLVGGERLEAVFRRAMARQATDRFAACGEFATAFEEAAREPKPVVVAPPPPEPKGKRTLLLWIGAALLLLIGLGIGALWMFEIEGPPAVFVIAPPSAPPGEGGSKPSPQPPPQTPAPPRRWTLRPVVPPKLIHQVQADYTEDARLRGVRGAVLLAFEVDEQGGADRIRVARSLDPGLDRKAVEALRQWRFDPATRGGKAVRFSATAEVNFKLLGRRRP